MADDGRVLLIGKDMHFEEELYTKDLYAVYTYAKNYILVEKN